MWTVSSQWEALQKLKGMTSYGDTEDHRLSLDADSQSLAH